MDSIIVLLLVLVPLVFKLVGRRLESAGNEGDLMDEAPSMSEVFPAIEEFEAEEKAEAVKKPVVREEAVRALPQKQPKKKVKAYSTEEAEKPKKKEAIDPKKLVIYSEIMKPKF